MDQASKQPTIRPLYSWRAAICASDLAPVARHVALTLSLHMSEVGDSCFPSQQTLAHETGLCERAIRTHLRALENAGWLVMVRRGGRSGDGHTWSSSYEATIANRKLMPVDSQSQPESEAPQPAYDDMSTGTPIPPRTSLRTSVVEDSIIASPSAKAEKRRTRIPDDFAVTDHMRAWARENVPTVDLEWQTSQFVDHYRADGRPQLDWTRRWYTWMRNAATRFAPRNGHDQANRVRDRIKRVNARLIAEGVIPAQGQMELVAHVE